MTEPLYNEDKAMNLIYDILTSKENIYELLNKILETNENYYYFPFNPLDYSKEDINKVLTYFSNRDEFEKCIKIMECCSVKIKK